MDVDPPRHTTHGHDHSQKRKRGKITRALARARCAFRITGGENDIYVGIGSAREASSVHIGHGLEKKKRVEIG